MPGAFRDCKVTRLLRPAFKHYEIAATVGPNLRFMRSCRPVLDTGAGINLVRPNLLPENWKTFAEELPSSPSIKDANSNRLEVRYAIHLFVDTGGVKVFERFFVADRLSVPCILGTEFIERCIEGILPRRRMVVWSKRLSTSVPDQRPTPVLACLANGQWERHWVDRPARVRACQQLRVKGRTERWLMVTCDTPGLATISPNVRLCRHKSMGIARGVVIIKPDEPFLLKVCNFGPDEAIIRKNATLGHAEPYQGPMMSAVDEPSSDQQEDKSDAPSSKPDAPLGDPIEDVDLSEAPEHLHKQIREMLQKHSKMWDGILGVIRATEPAIVTEPGTLPIRAQPYRTGPFKWQIISDQINKMLKMNVIEPSHSARASPVVIVPKKNGKARFCVDYRRLNNVTKKDAYPLPRMEDCLDSLGDAKVFTSLDCTAGYWQVPLRKEDREKTAFTTHAGIYHWLSMPFGLTNAPATFQRALDIILSGLKWQLCLVYLDDVIIFSANAEQHIKDVDTVLSRLHEAGVTLNLEKCTWFSDQVEYLGHIVRPGELHVHNKNVDALKTASFPTTKTQLKNFLGMCNVYRRFVKDFAKRAKPLNALTRAEVLPALPKPTQAQEASFEDLRQALLSPPVLALPKANHRMVLNVDACADQLGATLLQEEKDGTLHPVEYWSRGLSPAECNYSTTERECLGVVWSVLKLRHFLDGQRFLIRSDHQALSWIYSTTDSSGRLMRWRLRLAEYTFDMQYKPGASHHIPDFLSRTDNDAPMEPIQDDIPCLALAETANGLETGRYTGGETPKPIEFDDIVEAQQADSWCTDMLTRVSRGTAKAFFQNEHHALYRRSQHGNQWVIPISLRERLLWWEHTATIAAHPGINRM